MKMNIAIEGLSILYYLNIVLYIKKVKSISVVGKTKLFFFIIFIIGMKLVMYSSMSYFTLANFPTIYLFLSFYNSCYPVFV
jgi:hypothetical protein